MSIHRTSDGTWRVKYRENGRQRSKNFPTKALATRFDAEVKERKIEGRPMRRRKDAPTIEEFAVNWLAERDDLAPNTWNDYASALEKHVIPYIGHLRIHASEIRPKILSDWMQNRLKAGAGKESVRKAQVALSQILDHAVLPHELLEMNPMVPVKKPKQLRKQPRYLTATEVEKIKLAFLDDDDIESSILVSVLGYVGIRPQDALALDWQHIGDKLSVVVKNVDGTIHDGSKTGANKYLRQVELPGPVREELANLRVLGGSPAQGPIFTADGTTHWNDYRYRNWRRRDFAPAVKRAGLGPLTPYALRHTCASLMAAAGRNHLEIAHQLGHSPETSVRLYQHLIDAGAGPRRSIDEWITDARDEVREADAARGSGD